MVVRDLKDVCFLSYFSVMDDLRQNGPPNSKYYEIRCCHWKPLCLCHHVSKTLLVISYIYAFPKYFST